LKEGFVMRLEDLATWLWGMWRCLTE
jgi:hypothetical protein